MVRNLGSQKSREKKIICNSIYEKKNLNRIFPPARDMHVANHTISKFYSYI